MATKALPKLEAEKRDITGRKVKKLRRDGVLPANVFGKKVKSQAVQVNLKTFQTIYSEVGETGVVDLVLKGDKEPRPILIQNVQLHPVSDLPLHADLRQVSLKEKVTASIPVEIVGESPAVKEKIGVLIQPLTEVEVEALPTDLPENFEVEVGSLAQVDDALTVGDLKVPAGVTVLTEAEQVLVKVEPAVQEEPAEPEPAPEEGEAAAEGETPEGETPEGEAPAEAEVKPAEGKPEEDSKKE